MIINLIPQEKMLQLGFLKFVAMFSILFGFVFLGVMAAFIFIYENAFSMSYGKLAQAIAYGIFMALVTWFRIRKSGKAAKS